MIFRRLIQLTFFMEQLNLPEYSFNIRSQEQRKYIFDTILKKYVLLTPEEWVRQNFIRYLTEEKEFPVGLISIEKEFMLNKLSKRYDAIVYSKKGFPVLLIECKAPSVAISQKVFDQITRYNIEFKVPYLLVTNGLKHILCRIDYINRDYSFLKDIPAYSGLEIL